MDIYAHPVNKFVAGFIGKASFVKPDSVLSVSGGKARVILFGKEITIPASDNCSASGECTCMIRPEDIKISKDGRFTAKIVSKAYFGQYIQHFLDICGQEVEQMDFSQTNAYLSEGDNIQVDFMENSLRLLPGDSTLEI